MLVNKLDYLYRKLVVKSREQHNETVDISDDDYEKYYNAESGQDNPIPGSDIPIPAEDENYLLIGTWQSDDIDIPVVYNGITFSSSKIIIQLNKDGGGVWVSLYQYQNAPINYNYNLIRWQIYNNIYNLYLVTDNCNYEIYNVKKTSDNIIRATFNQGNNYPNYPVYFYSMDPPKNWEDFLHELTYNDDNYY